MVATLPTFQQVDERIRAELGQNPGPVTAHNLRMLRDLMNHARVVAVQAGDLRRAVAAVQRSGLAPIVAEHARVGMASASEHACCDQHAAEAGLTEAAHTVISVGGPMKTWRGLWLLLNFAIGCAEERNEES